MRGTFQLQCIDGPFLLFPEACEEFKDDAAGLKENVAEGRTPSSFRRAGKEPIEYEVDEVQPRASSMQQAVQRRPVEAHIERQPESAQNVEGAGITNQRRSRSPHRNYPSYVSSTTTET